MINIEKLSVQTEDKLILKNINLIIPDKEIHLLLGPNGSGKTSLLMTIMGYPQYQIIDGGISIDGQDITGLSITERARLGIGLAEQRPPSIPGVKLKMLLDYILDGAEEKREFIYNLIKDANWDYLLERDINIGFSGGEIKKMELLLLLSRQLRFAMLDEPDSGVDIESLEFLNMLIARLYPQKKDSFSGETSGLIITHSKQILDCIDIDVAHVIIDGEIICSGNPSPIIEKIIGTGFESCMECRGQKYV